ncbi:MAG: NADH-quinone oxidoreductase subunit NuoE [Deltaproteobacteria bacterium]|nr:NADH-quinone oxidoreductase subunit NuoE [Deltaproteobacteria bacterium]
MSQHHSSTAQAYSKEVQFSEKTMTEFKNILAKYDSKRSALLPVLHLTQDEFGHLSDEAIVYVAKLMDLSPAQVLEVVSFYHMFHRHPVGQHHLQFCVTLSCWMNGSHQLMKSTCSRLGIRAGETTADGKFSVVGVECLGSCGSAPVVQVNETYYENLTPEKLNRLIASCKDGEPRQP